ncbi:hypothetical protein ACC848_37880, partial [Rhizobium johnstonii]
KLDGAGNSIPPLTADEIAAGVEGLSLDRLRAHLDGTMQVRLLRAPRGRKGFDPATVQTPWR